MNELVSAIDVLVNRMIDSEAKNYNEHIVSGDDGIDYVVIVQVKKGLTSCQKLAKIEAQSKWISADDELPEDSGAYPACAIKDGREPPKDWIDSLCEFNSEAKDGQSKWQHISGFYDNGITHWLKLNPPTK